MYFSFWLTRVKFMHYITNILSVKYIPAKLKKISWLFFLDYIRSLKYLKVFLKNQFSMKKKLNIETWRLKWIHGGKYSPFFCKENLDSNQLGTIFLILYLSLKVSHEKRLIAFSQFSSNYFISLVWRRFKISSIF